VLIGSTRDPLGFWAQLRLDSHCQPPPSGDGTTIMEQGAPFQNLASSQNSSPSEHGHAPPRRKWEAAVDRIRHGLLSNAKA